MTGREYYSSSFRALSEGLSITILGLAALAVPTGITWLLLVTSQDTMPTDNEFVGAWLLFALITWGLALIIFSGGDGDE